MQFYADYSNRLNPDCYDTGRAEILALICHNTAKPFDKNYPGQSAAEAQALSDATARYLASNDRQVSVHCLVGAEACGGPIYKIVPESFTTYHCGGNPPNFPSRWTDPDTSVVWGGYALNQHTVGVEVFGQVGDVLGPNQLASLNQLVLDIVSRRPKLAQVKRIVAHSTLERDRSDGGNWAPLAQGWVANRNNTGSNSTGGTGTVSNDYPKWVANGYEVNDEYGFLSYHQSTGGIPQHGLPITGAHFDPGLSLVVQWFERSRFEFHPEATDPAYRVQKGLLGMELLAKK